jgi:hypothetical protein
MTTQPTLGELQHALAEYSREHEKLLATIRDARMEARKVTIESAACKQPIARATIDRWQRIIKEASAELLAVDQQIGETNKLLRAARAASNQANNRANKPAIKALDRLPKDAIVRSTPETVRSGPANGEAGAGPRPGHVLFLEFFYQLTGENLDPRQLAVLERDAHSLVDEYLATHGREEASES